MNRQMKALFVIKSAYNFSYVQSIIEALEERDVRVDLLFDKQWSENLPQDALREFLSESSKTSSYWLVRRSDYWRRWIFAIREIRTYLSYTRRTDQSDFYEKRWGGYVNPLTRRLIKPFRNILSDSIFRWIESKIPPDRGVVEDILNRKPDVVIATPANHRFSEEIEYVKAAKARDIPTVIPVLSWDNLTTKGLFHVIPDILLVWNEHHRKEARDIHGVTVTGLTGAPFFDKWIDRHDPIESREVFCKRMGLNPKRPFILYLGSSYKIEPNETRVVEKFKKQVPSHIGVLVRPHPTNPINGVETPLPESAASRSEFASALKHCSIAVGVNTSGMIDAIIHDKPTFSIKPQDQTVHFRYLKPALGWNGKRKQFVKECIFPRGRAGDLAANQIMVTTIGYKKRD